MCIRDRSKHYENNVQYERVRFIRLLKIFRRMVGLENCDVCNKITSLVYVTKQETIKQKWLPILTGRTVTWINRRMAENWEL